VLSTRCCIRFIRQDSRLAVRPGLRPLSINNIALFVAQKALLEGGLIPFAVKLLSGGESPTILSLIAQRDYRSTFIARRAGT